MWFSISEHLHVLWWNCYSKSQEENNRQKIYISGCFFHKRHRWSGPWDHITYCIVDYTFLVNLSLCPIKSQNSLKIIHAHSCFYFSLKVWSFMYLWHKALNTHIYSQSLFSACLWWDKSMIQLSTQFQQKTYCVQHMKIY